MCATFIGELKPRTQGYRGRWLLPGQSRRDEITPGPRRFQ